MKIARFFLLILLILPLAGCAEYYQAQVAQAEATAAPYDSAARIAEAQKDAQIAELDTQRQIVSIQATAQSEQAGLLVTQTSKSLGILEDAANRQVELLESQYRTMQLNSLILVIGGVLILAACLILIAWLILRSRRGAVEVRREIVYLPAADLRPPVLIDPEGDQTQPLFMQPQLPMMRQRRRDG